MEEEIATLHLLHTLLVEFQVAVASEIDILGETMVVVYEEMEKSAPHYNIHSDH